ncbi:transmembrane protein 201 [Platysternon megacephalum]|uniref:Transmembrane protein 201 n=1 Tax=Platysternon megacephalum TaxID=55544 RepID=A0A4D9F6R0_9SAUR|nr:transmembrane protein 201 [Platysternon megacephalum]
MEMQNVALVEFLSKARGRTVSLCVASRGWSEPGAEPRGVRRGLYYHCVSDSSGCACAETPCGGASESPHTTSRKRHGANQLQAAPPSGWFTQAMLRCPAGHDGLSVPQAHPARLQAWMLGGGVEL